MANKTYIAKDIRIEADLTDYYTKAEVDAAIANVDVTSQLANYLPLTGGTISNQTETSKDLLTLDYSDSVYALTLNQYKESDNDGIVLQGTLSLDLDRIYRKIMPNREYSLIFPYKSGTLATLDDIPSINGLASETWVNQQGFLKEHQDISGKLDSSVFNIYKTEHQSEYSTLNDKVNTFLGANNETLSGIKDLITAAEESDEINALTTALGNKADASALTTHTGNSDIHVTSEDKAAWNNKVDQSQLDNYTTKTWVENNTVNKKLEIYNSSGTKALDFSADNNTLSIGSNATTKVILSGDSTGSKLTLWADSNNGYYDDGYQITALPEYLDIHAPSIKTLGPYVSGDPNNYHLSMTRVGTLWGSLLWQNGSTTLGSIKLTQDHFYFTDSANIDHELAYKSDIPEVPDITGKVDRTELESYATKEWADNKYQTKADAENHIISSDSTVNNIVYSETEPENPTVGMIWLKPAQ